MASENRRVSTVCCEVPTCQYPGSRVWYCDDCGGSKICEGCWDSQIAHAKGRVGRDGVPHEQADPVVVEVYKKILEPPTDATELALLHLADAGSLWFDVHQHDKGEEMFLRDHGRYSSLMSNAAEESESRVKYPQLVSFIGNTSVGKSTIIQALIRRHQFQGVPVSPSKFPSPVAGSVTNEKNATTGDVHLYADPATWLSPMPVLFADCEGLEGGNLEPMSHGHHRQGKKLVKQRGNRNKTFPRYSRTSARAKAASRANTQRVRAIQWATSEAQKTRGYVVKELYPRLLYTFSDVVVFVAKDAQVFQSILEKLIDWGDASLESSLNVPRLPHAVVVLNKTPVKVNEWDPQTATNGLLNSIKAFEGFGKVPRFEKLAAQWNSQDPSFNVRTAFDLLLKYYSTFTVVRIPNGEGHFGVLDKQVARLQEVVLQRCLESFSTKQSSHMPITSDATLNYLQAGFHHFSATLTKPFDFIKLNLEQSPPPEDFADHIWALMSLLVQKAESKDPESLLSMLGSIIACCVVMNASQREGAIPDLFRGYVEFLKLTFHHFSERYWPCAFQGGKRKQVCSNSCSGHASKGHQNAFGKVIGKGEHDFGLDIDQYRREWLKAIESNVKQQYEELRSTNSSPRESATILQKHVSAAYNACSDILRLISHGTCLCCLMETPTHALPCGHIICARCVSTFGETDNETTTTLTNCPLHTEPFSKGPWRIARKPHLAGVRILALDGGGIRGIVELEALKAIEEELGGDLPIQAFFDLVVGTSTGGIIALALGVKQWSLDRCIELFKSLCHQAFTRRDADFVPDTWTILARQSLYQTKPLYQALQKSLGSRPMFGGKTSDQPQWAINVAVTTHSDTGKGPAIITNYNRPEGVEEEFDFVRSPDPSREMLIWQAAAATSAAPKYFKTYIHEATDTYYVDGALYWNNPSPLADRERKLLWPDMGDAQPDILVSIGSGLDAAAMKNNMDWKSHDLAAQEGMMRNRKAEFEGVTKKSKRRKRFRKSIKVLAKRFDNMLDTELSWRTFHRAVDKREQYWDRRPLPYVRLNVDLHGPPPKLDAVDQLDSLQLKALKDVKSLPSKETIEKVACQLIASTFYFHKDTVCKTDGAKSVASCRGRIVCRFDNNTDALRALGLYFHKHQSKAKFVVEDSEVSQLEQEFPLDQNQAKAMATHGHFEPITISFPIGNISSKTNIALILRGNAIKDLRYPLSGFPRHFLLEQTKMPRHGPQAPVTGRLRLLARWKKEQELASFGYSGTASDASSLHKVAMMTEIGAKMELTDTAEKFEWISDTILEDPEDALSYYVWTEDDREAQLGALDSFSSEGEEV